MKISRQTRTPNSDAEEHIGPVDLMEEQKETNGLWRTQKQVMKLHRRLHTWRKMTMRRTTGSMCDIWPHGDSQADYWAKPPNYQTLSVGTEVVERLSVTEDLS